MSTSPADINAEYARALRDLTFNSKPIINNLTIMAHQQAHHHAPSIARTILAHLQGVPVKLKLPALYLIDSICKNIGQPYIDQFCAGGRLRDAYLAAYRGLGGDEGLEREFQRVLATWPGVMPSEMLRELEAKLRPASGQRDNRESKDSRESRDNRESKDSRDGHELRDGTRDGHRTSIASRSKSPRKRTGSGRDDQHHHDRSGRNEPLRSRSSRSPRRRSRSRSRTRSPTRKSSASLKASSSSVKPGSSSSSASRQRSPSSRPTELSRGTIGLLEELLQSVSMTDPLQYSALRVAQALEGLYRVTDLAHSTITKLDQLAQSPDKRPLIESINGLLGRPLHAPPVYPPTAFYSPTAVPFQTTVMPPPLPPPSTVPPPPAMTFPMGTPFPFAPPMPPPTQPTLYIPPVSTPLIPENLQSLLASISTQLAATTTATNNPASPDHQPSSSSSSSPQIPLTYEAIQVPRPGLHRKLYDDISLRCATCSFRFYDTPQGKELMSQHLDAHFRRNMRLKDRSRRVLARDWFPSAAQWISQGSEGSRDDQDAKDDHHHHNHQETSRRVSPFAQADPPLHKTAAVSSPEHSVPVGSDKPGRSCAICKEVLAVEWDHDQDEWVYRGALRIHQKEHPNDDSDKVVAHVTCAGTL